MAEPVFDPRLLSLRAAGARWLQDRRPGDARQFADGAAVIVEQLDSLGAEVERLRAALGDARDELATARQFREAEADYQRVMKRAERAEAERDHYRERLAETDQGAAILALEETIAAADDDRDRLAEQPTVRVDDLARAISSGDVQINHGDYPAWDDLAGSGRDAYRQLARHLLATFRILAALGADAREVDGHA